MNSKKVVNHHFGHSRLEIFRWSLGVYAYLPSACTGMMTKKVFT